MWALKFMPSFSGMFMQSKFCGIQKCIKIVNRACERSWTKKIKMKGN